MDLNKLLTPIDGENPCGENLEYDPQFAELERAAVGKAEQQMGNEVVAAEPADWKSVRRICTELFDRTKDLRIAVYLTRASMQIDGLASLADHVELLNKLVEQHWDHVHPELDADDNNDPTMRVNIFASLVSDEILRNVREAPIVESKMLGRFGLKDVEISMGAAEAPPQKEGDPPPPDAAMIDAAFMDCDLEALQATTTSVQNSMEGVVNLETALTQKVGADRAVDLSALPNLLRQIHSVLSEKLQRRGVVAEGAAAGAAAGADGAQGGGAAAPQPIQGEIQSREDVIRMIDKACDWFAKNEPSSPVPLLLVRAKRLVSKNFMEIMRDLAPEGVKPVEKISGVED